MNSAVDTRIAEENRIRRAVEAATAPPPVPQLPDAALIAERLAVNGKDRGAETRKKLAEELSGLVARVGQMHKNPTLSASQKLLGIDGFVQSHVGALLAKCDEEEAVIDTLQRSVDAGIDAALTPPRTEWHALGAEYRAVMRGMTADERADFVERVEGTRDAAALRYAIGSVPPELSGVSFGIHKKMVDTLLALKDPELLTRPADLKKRRAALEVARDGIKRTGAELVDGEAASILRALVPGDDVP